MSNTLPDINLNMKKTSVIWLLVLIFTFFLTPIFTKAQKQSKADRLDSLKLKFRKDSARIYRFQKFRFRLALDQRNSWIKNTKANKVVPVSINGLQIGGILYERHTVGFGLYNIASFSTKAVKLTDNTNSIRFAELYMRYYTLFYEYAIICKKYFEIDIPIEIGLGRYTYNLKDETKNERLWNEDGPITIYGIGTQLIIKPVKWIGLVGMGGYRYTTFTPDHIESKNPNAVKETQLDFRNFYYSYGVWIDLRQIMRDVHFYGFKRPKYRKKLKAILASEG